MFTEFAYKVNPEITGFNLRIQCCFPCSSMYFECIEMSEIASYNDLLHTKGFGKWKL